MDFIDKHQIKNFKLIFSQVHSFIALENHGFHPWQHEVSHSHFNKWLFTYCSRSLYVGLFGAWQIPMVSNVFKAIFIG